MFCIVSLLAEPACRMQAQAYVSVFRWPAPVQEIMVLARGMGCGSVMRGARAEAERSPLAEGPVPPPLRSAPLLACSWLNSQPRGSAQLPASPGVAPSLQLLASEQQQGAAALALGPAAPAPAPAPARQRSSAPARQQHLRSPPLLACEQQQAAEGEDVHHRQVGEEVNQVEPGGLVHGEVIQHLRGAGVNGGWMQVEDAWEHVLKKQDSQQGTAAEANRQKQCTCRL